MYWPGTTAAGGAAGFEAALALRVTRQDTESVASPPVTASRPAGQGHDGVPIARQTPVLPCTEDPDLFFAESPADVETAKALCRGCAIRLACLSGARERREPWGVWGGELFLRGEVVPRKRPRGRPRKTEVAA
jgi:WhiB family redox-sensing transcriptional regulator